MNEPWGISGPDFTVLYLVLVVLGIAAFFVVRVVQSGSGKIRSDEADGLFELAYLAGGPGRVAETALAELVDRGVVRVSRAAHVSAVDSADLAATDDPILRQALEKIKGGRKKKVGGTVYTLAVMTEVDELGENLRERGLISSAGRGRKRLWRLLPLFLVLAVGVLRLINGWSQHRPVGYLFLLVALGVIAWLVLRRVPLPERGPRGGARLRTVSAALFGAAGLVAAGGLGAYPDDTLSAAFLAAQPIPMRQNFLTGGGGDTGTTFSHGGGGGGGCGSNSGCGGGGGCGGGCGG